MAGQVRAATAYIDIKLGSFTEFQAAAERRAKETAQRIAKRMTEEIEQKVDGKKAGQKLGDDIAQQTAKRTNTLGDLINAKLGPAFQKVGNVAKTALSGIPTLFSGIGTGINKLGAGLAKVSGAFENVGRKIGFASFMAQGLGYDLTFAVTAPAVGAAAAFGYFGIKAALNLEQARASMAAFVGGLGNAQKEIEILADIAAKSPAFDTIQIIAYAKSLLAAGLSQAKTNDLFRATSNIFTTLGLTVDQANGAFYAITQVMQKGKVQSEELSLQLAERGIPIWKILADSLGVTQEKLIAMVAAGEVTSTQFVDAMIKAGSSGKYLEGAGTGADTLKAKFASLKEQIQYKLAVAFEKHLFPLLNELTDKYGPKVVLWFDNFADTTLPKVKDKIKELATGLEDLKKKWDAIPESTKDTIKQFLLLLIAAGPTIIAVSKLGAAVGAIGSVAGLLTTKLGFLVAILAILGYVVFQSRDQISDFFTKTDEGKESVKKLKQILEDLKTFFDEKLKPAIKTTTEAIGGAFNAFINSKEDLKGINGDFGELSQHFKDIAKDLREELIPAWDTFKGALKDAGIDIEDTAMWMGILKGAIKGVLAVIGVVASVFAQAFGLAAIIVAGVVRIIVDIVKGAINILVGIFRVAGALFGNETIDMSDAIRQIWDGLWMLVIGTLFDAIMTIIGFIVGLVKGIIRLWKYLYDILVGHSIIPDMVNAIIDWFKKLPGKIGEFIKDTVDKGVAKFNEFKDKAVDAVKDLPDKVANKVGEVKGKILDKVSGFKDLLFNSGKELVQGLINGIDRMLGPLGSKANEMANTVAKKLPGSPVKEGPLKVLNNGYAGKQIVRMIAGGMNPKPVALAAYSVAAAAVPGITSAGVGISGSIDPGGVAGGLVINQTVNVPNPVQDPRDIADYSTRRLVSALTTKATL